MNPVLRSASVLALAAAALAASAQSIVDFEDLSGGNAGTPYTYYAPTVTSRGFDFTAPGANTALNGSGAAFYNYTGSVALQVQGRASTPPPLTMVRHGGGTFGVASLAVGNTFAPGAPSTLTLTGTLASGGTVVRSFTTSGAAGLQTATFSGLTGLTSLAFFLGDDNPIGVSIDNIVLAPVPEPATMAALGLGAVVVLKRRKRA